MKLSGTEALSGRKVCIWMNYPSAYQRSFFEALINKGVELQVFYYREVPTNRTQAGWSVDGLNCRFEMRVRGIRDALKRMEEQSDATHILPGYESKLSRALIVYAIFKQMRWVHWSEPSQPRKNSWLTWGFKFVYAQIVNRSAYVALAICNTARRDFEKWGIASDKICLLTYSRSYSPQCHTRTIAQDDELIFGFVGSLNKRKGIDVLIKAFNSVANENKCSLHLIGPNEFEDDWRNLLSACQNKDRIVLRGAISAAEIFSALEQIDVFTFPSRFDGWGVALQEAALAGCALVATSSCGASEHLIENGRNGFVVRPESEADLARAMSFYISNRALVSSHGERSRQLAAGYTPEMNAERLVSALTERGTII